MGTGQQKTPVPPGMSLTKDQGVTRWPAQSHPSRQGASPECSAEPSALILGGESPEQVGERTGTRCGARPGSRPLCLTQLCWSSSLGWAPDLQGKYRQTGEPGMEGTKIRCLEDVAFEEEQKAVSSCTAGGRRHWQQGWWLVSPLSLLKAEQEEPSQVEDGLPARSQFLSEDFGRRQWHQT